LSPIRIVILGILFYLLYKLLFSKKTVPDKSPSTAAPEGQPLQDVLVEDPVCHTFVPKGQAESLKVEDQTYYFCSEECRKTFQNKEESEE
jgi:YHS domain-containing protein